MADGKSPEKKRPRRSLSSSKTKKPGAPSIVSFFNNAPPAKLACPACCKMVPRYHLNQHLDQGCGGSAHSSTVDSGHLGSRNSNKRTADTLAQSPAKTPMTPGQSESSPKGNKQRTSPYFNRDDLTSPSRDERGLASVTVIPLGSLSSKLCRKTRRCLSEEAGFTRERPPRASSAAGPCTENDEKDPPSGNGSQKENLGCDFPGRGSRGTAAESTAVSPGPALCPHTPASSGQQAPESLSPHVSLGAQLQTTSEEALAELVEAPEAQAHLVTPLDTGSQSPAWGDAQEGPPRGDSNCQGDVTTGPSPLEQGDGDRSPVSAAAALPGHPYYLQSFLLVLRTVFEHEEDRTLFDAQEQAIVAQFHGLSGQLPAASRGHCGAVALPSSSGCSALS